MESPDEIVEKQKLVQNDPETEMDDEPDPDPTTNVITTGGSSGAKSLQTSTPTISERSQKIDIDVDTKKSEASLSLTGRSSTADSSQAGGVSKMYFVNERRQQSGKQDTKTYKGYTKKDKPDIELIHKVDVETKNYSNARNPNTNSFANRPLKHHSFLSDAPDVRNMERALLTLLDDFNSGKLKAFGSGGTMEQMTDIREQQEQLAKLHFELGANFDYAEDGKVTNISENMGQLLQKLEHLSESIEKLHSNNADL